MNENNATIWSKPDCVAAYAGKNQLFKTEKLIFQTCVGNMAGMKVPDLGCGTGRVAAAISDEVQYIKGVDISLEMVNVFRDNFPRFDCSCSRMDVIDEPVVFYDMAIIPYNSIDYVSPKESRLEVFSRVYKSLKPGGVFIFSSHNPMGWLGVWIYSRSPGTWLRALKKLLTGEVFKNEGYFSNKIYDTTFDHYFGVPSLIMDDVKGVGFEYLVQRGGNLAFSSQGFNHVFETWVYYAFRKPA